MSTARTRLLAIVAAVGLAGAGALAWRWWNGDEGSVLLASGTIEATEVRLSFRLSGRLVERFPDEGDRVEAGVLVARLESPELEADVERLRASLEATQTRVPQLGTEITLREELTRRRVAEARAVLAAREARLAELQSGARPEEIAEARAAREVRQARLAELRAGARPQEVKRARAEARAAEAVRDQAQAEFARMEALFRDGLIAAQTRDAARTAFEVARQQHATATERLALIREGPRQEQIRAAEAEVRQAEAILAKLLEGPREEELRRAAAEVRQAEAMVRLAAAGELEVVLLRQQLATAEAGIARDRAALAAATAQLGYTSLRSPQNGVVLRKHAEPGEVLVAGTPIVTLADLENIWLKVYIPERQLGRVKLGHAAEIQTDSYPGKVYRGTVTFVSSEAEFTPKNVQTQEERVKLVFAVKISVDNPNQELKPGMPADARLLLD